MDTLSNLKFIEEKIQKIPDYILRNLNQDFPIRKYQREALLRFIFYIEHYPRRLKPTWLLFQMATGSGKTLVMVASILYLYWKGYRNFVFFVNSKNVIEKTKENFLNPVSPKYLFNDKLIMGAKTIRVKEVSEFQSVNSDDINIVFTTIQGLHSTLNNPGENSLTYDDFKNSKVVLLSDEAHHINAVTKAKLSKEEEENKNSWEYTVSTITKLNPSNILLEFTATLDQSNSEINTKYSEKLIYEYTLREFRQDGYSKEVFTFTTDSDPLERSLQAIILSQYRKKVAERNGIFLKPVVLFRSKTIIDSEKFEKDFRQLIANLSEEGLSLLMERNRSQSNVLRRAFEFFQKNHITLENLSRELRVEFDDNRCLSVNSESDSVEKQLVLNSLEEHENPIRAIFTVNMLNEGWDVLNLFDIVRLYETRDSKAGVPGKNTISEAQLIGRGARYYPFTIKGFNEKFKRKFDSDPINELKILEDFYFHSSNDSRYIQELRTALIGTGIIPPQTRDIEVKIKDPFKKSSFWANGQIFLNDKILNTRKETITLLDLKIPNRFKYYFHTGNSQETEIFDFTLQDGPNVSKKVINLSEFPEIILTKAMDKIAFFHFSNLHRYFPGISTIREFITKNKFLKDLSVEIYGLEEQLNTLNRENLLKIALSILDSLSEELGGVSIDFKGTTVFRGIPIKSIVKDKILHIAIEDTSGQERGRSMRESKINELRLDLANRDWYIYDDNYGTSEEKYLIKFLDEAMKDLKSKFQDVYLIRNEKLFQIYRYSDGSAIEPDFVLFFKDMNTGNISYYQLFIEPKGNHLLAQDKWKEEFLAQIEDEHEITTTLYQNDDYYLIGMPFYTESNKHVFERKFKDITGII